MNEKKELKGIFIAGVVAGRTKRFVGEKKNEVVTYRINDGDRDYMIDEWNADNYHAVGADICLPIYCKAYQTKRGQIYTSLIVNNGKNSSSGEEF